MLFEASPIRRLSRLRKPRAVFSVCLVGLLTTLASRSFAQSQDPVAATELFMKGRDAVERQDYEAACPLFAESSQLDLKVGTLLNLADCEEQVGMLADALQHWKQAMHLGLATGDRRIDEARRRLEAVEARVPRLAVLLAPGAPSSVQVLRDGVPVGRPSLGVKMPINPGKHIVEVHGDGHEVARFEFVMKEGESKELRVAPGPKIQRPPSVPTAPPPQPGPTAPPPVKPTEHVEESDNTLAYLFGGAGIAGVVVGSVTGLMLMNKNKTIDEQCNAENHCTREGLDAVDEAKTLLPISNVAWVVGVVGLGTSTYLFLTSGPAAPSDEALHGFRRPQGIGFQIVGKL